MRSYACKRAWGIFIQNQWYNVKRGETRKAGRKNRYKIAYARNSDYKGENI